MVVEERERLAGLQGFEPEIDLAEFHGHGVDVHAEDAVADHIAEGLSVGFRGRLFVAGANGGQTLGDAVGGGNQEMAAAAGGVADLQRQNRFGLRESGFGSRE